MASANRAMRRRQAKIEQKQAQLFKNGITNKDLEAEYVRGYKAGLNDKAWNIIRAYYSATLIALHDEYGFGQERCLRALRAVETNLIKHLTNLELIEEAEKKLKIEINVEEGIERAQPM